MEEKDSKFTKLDYLIGSIGVCVVLDAIRLLLTNKTCMPSNSYLPILLTDLFAGYFVFRIGWVVGYHRASTRITE